MLCIILVQERDHGITLMFEEAHSFAADLIKPQPHVYRHIRAKLRLLDSCNAVTIMLPTPFLQSLSDFQSQKPFNVNVSLPDQIFPRRIQQSVNVTSIPVRNKYRHHHISQLQFGRSFRYA